MKMDRWLSQSFYFLFIIFFFAALVPPQTAHGEDAKDNSGRLKPEGRFVVNYPNSLAGRRAEGWMIVRYLTKKDGTLTDIRVVRSSGNEQFENAAIHGLEKARFEPATQNGIPAAYFNPGDVFTFLIRDADPGARRAFANSYKGHCQENY